MYYSVQHVTTFHYSAPIAQSVMEVRAQPRTEGPQRCLSFQLKVSPRATVQSYRDHLGNAVHHFNIPGKHQKLVVIAESVVELRPGTPIPETFGTDAWEALDAQARSGEFFDFLAPSDLARPSSLLQALASELDVLRRGDPLSLLRELNAAIYRTFDYAPDATQVDSPIDDALRARQGVCQDFTHVLITLVRGLGIPCRYVSGYLYHGATYRDRSAADATHAWAEAWLPDLGWVGFDPTNNLICEERHIRTAVGRDYVDVPPTRGVFKGKAETELEVAVKVQQAHDVPVMEAIEPEVFTTGEDVDVSASEYEQQQQQQQ